MLQVPLAETNKILAKMSTTSSVTTIAIHDPGIDSRTNRVRSNRVEVDRRVEKNGRLHVADQTVIARNGYKEERVALENEITRNFERRETKSI